MAGWGPVCLTRSHWARGPRWSRRPLHRRYAALLSAGGEGGESRRLGRAPAWCAVSGAKGGSQAEARPLLGSELLQLRGVMEGGSGHQRWEPALHSSSAPRMTQVPPCDLSITSFQHCIPRVETSSISSFPWWKKKNKIPGKGSDGPGTPKYTHSGPIAVARGVSRSQAPTGPGEQPWGGRKGARTGRITVRRGATSCAGTCSQ